MGFDERYKYYGRSVNEFLGEYLDYNMSTVPQIKDRCGVIRHAINIDFEKEDFNEILFSFSRRLLLAESSNFIVGIDGRVPDVDYFAMLNKLLQSLSTTFHYKFPSKLEKRLQSTMQSTGIFYIISF